jgi:SPP1 family predicted phage head-tail adaptor
MRNLQPGRLRHLVVIERPVTTLDSDGVQSVEWVPAFGAVAQTVAARIESISGREILAAAQMQSKVTHRVTLRAGRDVVASMRLRRPGGGPVYNVEAVIPDNASRVQWMTLLCSSGVNDGG